MENIDVQTLKVSKAENLYIVFCCLGVASFCFFGIINSKQNLNNTLFVFLFIVIAALSIMVLFLIYPPRLILTREGFIIKTFYFQNKLYRWSDVEEFKVFRGLGSPRRISFKFKKNFPENPISETYREITRAVYDYSGLIDFNYGMDREALAVLLNKKRAEYLGLK